MSLARLTTSFSLGTSGEKAAFTISLTGPGGFVVQSDADALTPGLNTFLTALRTMTNSGIVTTRARLDVLDIATAKTLYGYDLAPTLAGGNPVSANLPTQCAVVVSLKTASSGPRFRGRMYMPPFTAASLTTDGRLLTATRDSLATAAAAWLTSIKATTPGWVPVVYSRTGGSTTAVTAVAVGDVIDTQRRRRADLVEARKTVLV
jgi:hypothetical protein